jgi:dihydroneopterin aldolase
MNRSPLVDGPGGLRHVFLRDMVLAASIGVHGFEHQAPQRVRINIDLGVEDDAVSAGEAVGRDELSRVVDYEKVADGVRAIVGSRHVRLVETLAERLAEHCLQDGRVRLVRVRVEKLDIFADTAAVGVEIERARPPSDGFIPQRA